MLKLVKVRMLIDTAYQGPRREGEEINVPADYALRWVDNGIAEYVNDAEGHDDTSDVDQCVNDTQEDGQADDLTDITEGTQADDTDDGDVDGEDANKDGDADETPEVDYNAMKPKELFELCKEKGIEAEPKKDKSYYIELLAAE